MQTLADAAALRAFLPGRRAAVLFHATWCPFCRRFQPAFAELAGNAPGWEAAELLLDDEDDPLWEELGIDVVPTVLAWDDGRPAGRLDGQAGIGIREADLRGLLGARG